LTVASIGCLMLVIGVPLGVRRLSMQPLHNLMLLPSHYAEGVCTHSSPAPLCAYAC
jgi:hypothetical protein